VAAVWPEAHAKLLTAIRKQFSRKTRRKAAAAGAPSEGGDMHDTRARTVITAARTARASEWGHTAIFSDDETKVSGTRSASGRILSSRKTRMGVRTGAEVIYALAVQTFPCGHIAIAMLGWSCLGGDLRAFSFSCCSLLS
jgi:hypothetical protein